ncbi:MAG TPA: CDP-alcohol phosphatidyltransferase family protein [Rhodanobacteraceae bacterium]
MALPAPVVRSASAWRHLPNAISVLRIVLVVPVALAIEDRCFRTALGLAVIAGVSDGVDGWLARHFNWRSQLGSVLDPIADKLLLVVCFVVLADKGLASWALAVLVLVRDFIIATGAWAWQQVIGDFRSRPSWMSKCCTTLQILYVLAVLLRGSDWWPQLPLVPLAWAVAVLTVISGLDYIVRWGNLARRELGARHRQGKHDES